MSDEQSTRMITKEQAVKAYMASGVPETRAHEIVDGVIERGGRTMFQGHAIEIYDGEQEVVDEGREESQEGVQESISAPQESPGAQGGPEESQHGSEESQEGPQESPAPQEQA